MNVRPPARALGSLALLLGAGVLATACSVATREDASDDTSGSAVTTQLCGPSYGPCAAAGTYCDYDPVVDTLLPGTCHATTCGGNAALPCGPHAKCVVTSSDPDATGTCVLDDPTYYTCASDEDCVAVSCSGAQAAVSRGAVDRYEQTYCGVGPAAPSSTSRVAQCNSTWHRCEMVDVTSISCGGQIELHHCPSGYACNDAPSGDATGTCAPTCNDGLPFFGWFAKRCPPSYTSCDQGLCR